MASDFLKQKAGEQLTKNQSTGASDFLRGKAKESREHMAAIQSGEQNKASSIPETGYYKLPTLGADRDRLYGDVASAELQLNMKKKALDEAQKAVTGAESNLSFWNDQLKLLQEAYTAYPSEANRKLYEKAYKLAKEVGDQYTTAYDAYNGVYGQYKPAWDAYDTAVKSYKDYTAGQQAQYDQWKSRIRDAETVKAEIDELQKQLDAANTKDKFNGLANLFAAQTAATSGQIYRPEEYSADKENLQKLQEQMELLEDEYYYAQKFGYQDLKENEDFLDKMKYVPTYNGKERTLDESGTVYTESGFDDLLYDYINGNAEAKRAYRTNNRDEVFYEQMTKDEIGIYNYLHATDPQKAQEYLEFIAKAEGGLKERDIEKLQEGAKAFAEKMPVISSLYSTLLSPAKGIGYLAAAGDFIKTGKIDTNDRAFAASHISGAVRQQVTNDIETNWGKVGSFAYQTGMSMADFLLNAAITGGLSGGGAISEGLSLGIMGTGAAADATIEAKERGLTDEQAFLLGTAAGFAEIITEKVSIEALLDADLLSDSAVKYLVKNALSEGGEEAGSDIINWFADLVVTKDKAEWMQAIAEYKQQGYSTEEAFGLAVKDSVLQTGLDALGGAISGAIMGGGNVILQSNINKEVAKDLQTANLSKEDIQDFIDTGLESAEDTASHKLATELQEKMDAGKEVTPEELARLYQANAVAIEDENRDLEEENQRLESLMQEAEAQGFAPEQEEDYGLKLPGVEETQENGGIQNGERRTETEAERAGTAGAAERAGADLSDGGFQRIDSTGAREQTGSMAESTVGQKSQALRRTKEVDLRRTQTRNLQKVSSKSLGLITGTDADNIKVIPQEMWDNSLKETADRVYRETGITPVFVVGKIQIRDFAGKIKNVKGVYMGNRMIVQADNLKFTESQIADHEIFHEKAAQTPGLVRQIRRRIAKMFTEEELFQVMNKYAEALDGVIDLNNGDIETVQAQLAEEIFADAYAGMNMFGANAPKFAETVNEVMQERNVGKLDEQANGVRQTNGPNEESFSIEELPDGKKYVRADRQVIFGNDPKSWSEQVEDYINGKIRRGSDVQLVADDGDVLLLTKDTAGKMADNHTSGGTTIPDDLFYVKANAAVHIDELAQISRGEQKAPKKDVDGRHGDFAKGGWTYRTAYFLDNDGKYYKLTLSVNRNENGMAVYNVGKIEERTLPKISGSSAKNGAVKEEYSFDDIIAQKDEGVKREKAADKEDYSLKLPGVEDGAKYSFDTEGNELTEEQAEYFRDSKIRDEDGNLRVVYHGTSERFTVFDSSKGRANMDIQGSFFSPWEDDAGGYGGNVGAYYLNIKNPASEGMGYKALNRFKGQNNAGVKARQYLESLGYDGVNNGDEEYIAFYPEQIKQVSNKAPTGDPDIRYSADEEEVNRKAAESVNRMGRKAAPVKTDPSIARRDFKQNVLNLFSVPAGQRQLMGTLVDAVTERMIKNGALTEDDRRRFFDRMYESGVMTVPADEYAAAGRDAIAGGKIFVPDSVRHEFGDDWNEFRRKAFAAGVYLTGNQNDYGIDMWNTELATNLPGLFDIDETDRRNILERIIQIAEDGKEAKVSLPEYTRQLAETEGISENEFLDNMERQMDWALRTFAEKANLEIKLKDRTERLVKAEREKSQKAMQAERLREAERRAKERAERQEKADQQRQRKAISELQQKTLKQLQWLKRNQYRAPEELQDTWKDVLGDIDVLAVSAANEMNWSDKYNATWKDLAQMYKTAKETDPNFLPSQELEKIVMRLDGDKIADLDPMALEDLYKAAVGLRTEFYNRNNVINDEMHRLFEEVYEDTEKEITEAPGGYTGKFADKLFNTEQMTPMNVLQRMAGWNPDSTFYSMAKQLERGERDIRAYKVKANRMLQEFLTENEEWVKRADGQGEDAVWYEIRVPELLELHMGDKPIFGDMVTVYMTPAQKVHMYLESKSQDNLRHMTGGRTFVNKELYSEEKRQEAFAQGKTIRLAPETVKAIVKDLTPEEQALANILEQFYNQFAKGEINRVSNILYGYDKAMSGNYAPIFTNKNYTKSEPGLFDVTAEGVGNLKGRKHAKNPSYNISAFDAFERNVDQTARFVGMAIPARNWTNLMNWRTKDNSTADIISHKWGDEGKNYITDLITTLQAGEAMKGDSVSGLADKIMSNYIGAVFGANPSIVLKQLGSIPLASVYLGVSNLPNVEQIRNIDTAFIGKYTQDLQWRTMGYSMPETKTLKDNPGWYDTNKFTSFVFGGGAITAMDGWAASVLWPWAENKVRKEFPELEMGTQEQINNGESPFYKKVAEEFENAVARSQSTSDEIHQSVLRKSKNPLTKAFTLFRSDSAQTYNAIRQKIGEAQYYMRTGADEKVIAEAKNAVGATVLTATVGYIWAEAVEFLMNLWKYKGKKYKDDDGELTAGSVLGNMAQGLIGDLAGVMVGGEELADIIGNILTGKKWYGISTPGMEQIGDVLDAIMEAGGGIRDVIADGWDVLRNGGNLIEYFRRNSNKMMGGIKEVAKTAATYIGGLPANNLEAYLLGLVKWVSPEMGAAYDDLWATVSKNNLKGLQGGELETKLYSILKNRKASEEPKTAKEIARLYEAGLTGAVPTETPSSISDGDESVKLSAADKQFYEKVWSSTVANTLDAIVGSAEYAQADDKEKEAMIKELYSYAAALAKAEVVDGYKLTGTNANTQKLTAAGIPTEDVLAWNHAIKDLKTAGKMESLKAWNISEYQKAQVIGTILGTDTKTTAGNESQYGKYLRVMETGLKTNQYIDMYTKDVNIDKYFNFVESGMGADEAYKTITAYYETRSQYDADGNKSYTQAEIKATIDAISGDEEQRLIAQIMGQKLPTDGLNLTKEQKAAIWQILTGASSAKNNPYSVEEGQRILDGKKEPESDAFADEVMRQLMGG